MKNRGWLQSVVYSVFGVVVLTGLFLWSLSEPGFGETYRFEKRRTMMVEWQLKKYGIKSPTILNVMNKVERHRFVPEAMSDHAYDDTPLPIGFDQTISQPFIVAFMTEALDLRGDEKVLEIGTGSGYQAAVLAELAEEVYTIEIIEPLSHGAQKVLKELGYRNIYFRVGDGYLGWPEAAPFDAIIVTAAPARVPTALAEQLKEGGRMIIPVGTVWQELRLLIKKEGKLQEKKLIPVRFVPMVSSADPKT